MSSPTRKRRTPLIAHVVHRLGMGGLENGLVNLVNRMPRDRYRHAIVCLSGYTDFRNRIERDDVEVVALHRRPGHDLALYGRVFRLLRRLAPDIVHTRNLGTLDMQAVAAAAGVRHRLHSEHGWEAEDVHGTSRKYRWLRRVLDPAVSGYVTMSLDIERWLTRTVGIAAKKVVQLYNGVDTARFRPPMGKVDGGEFTIGTVGRMQAVKDPATLLDAFERLCASSPERVLRLVFAGDGPLRAPLEAEVKRRGLAERVTFAGATDDVPGLLQGLDIFALPSLNEGISNTVLEAMASGLPVVATDVGGNGELVEPGVTGILVPPSDPDALADALRHYLRRPRLMKQHGAAGRERVEREFALDGMVGRYLDVYDALRAKRFPNPQGRYEPCVGL